MFSHSAPAFVKLRQNSTINYRLLTRGIVRVSEKNKKYFFYHNTTKNVYYSIKKEVITIKTGAKITFLVVVKN